MHLGCRSSPRSSIVTLPQQLYPNCVRLNRSGEQISLSWTNDWSELWDFPFKHLVSVRDKLIQFKIAHRAYFTPHRRHRMDSNITPTCWRYSHLTGDFIHVFWSCPAIAIYWQGVLYAIVSVVHISVPMSPRTYLLGLVKELAPKLATRILLSLLLFYARKAITLHWKESSPPSVKLWIKLLTQFYHYTRTHIVTEGDQLSLIKFGSFGWITLYVLANCA